MSKYKANFRLKSVISFAYSDLANKAAILNICGSREELVRVRLIMRSKKLPKTVEELLFKRLN